MNVKEVSDESSSTTFSNIYVNAIFDYGGG